MGEPPDEDDVYVEQVSVHGLEMFVLSVPLELDLPDDLTASERAVVLLALQGLSNAEIAAERGNALQTVANQLRMAFAKLGVNSRAELAARVYGS